MTQGSPWALKFAVAAMLSAFLAAFAYGQPPPRAQSGTQPSLRRVGLGYALGVRENRWAPVYLFLENPGPATEVAVRGYFADATGGRHPVTNETTVRLPARSQRTHTMFIRAGSADSVHFDLLRRGARIQRVEMAPRLLSLREVLVVGLTDSDQNFSADQRSTNGGPRLRFHNTMRLDETPSRWQGFEPADAIILGALPPEGLSYPQERAILDWVRAGGILILNPGGRPAGYEGTAFEAASPVRLLGERLVERVPALEDIYGPMPEGPRIGLSEAALREGTVHRSMGEFPLVVSRNEGAGRVVFVAFDLAAEPLTRWDAMRTLYSDLLQMRSRWPRPEDTRLAERAAGALDGMVGVKVLPTWSVGAFLALNAALVVALLVGVRHRREMAFAGLIVAAPAIALVINVIGARASGIVENSLAGVHVVQTASGQPFAGCHSFYALISPDDPTIDVGFDDLPSAMPDALLLPLLGTDGRTVAEAQRQAFVVDDGDIKAFRGVPLRTRAPTMFKASAVAPVNGGVSARAVLSSAGVRFDVENASPHHLRDASVAWNRNAATLPNLAPGRSASVTLTGGTAVGRTAQGMMADYSRSAIRGSMEDVVNAAFESNRLSDLADTGAAAFGWTDFEPVPLEVRGLTGPLKTEARTLWVTYADMDADGTRLLVPRGVAARRFGTQAVGLFEHGRWGEFSGRQEMDVVFRVPDPAVGIEATRIALWLRTARADARAGILAWNWETGQYDAVLGEILAPGDARALAGRSDDVRFETVEHRREHFTLDAPQNYLHPATGEVRLRVALEAAHVLADVGTGMARRPTLEDLDIEIEGIRP